MMLPTFDRNQKRVSVCLLAFGLLVAAQENKQLASKQQEHLAPKKNLSDEIQLITKSLDDLMSELSVIKREAMGRLSSVKRVVSATSISEVEPERIRQTKVSRFVLRRVLELETESQSMREELTKLFELGKLPIERKNMMYSSSQSKQEDHDFDEAPNKKPISTLPGMPAPVAAPPPTTTTTTTSTTSTTTVKPDEEAEKIGFDVEALKKLGDAIDQQLSQLQRHGRQMQSHQQQHLPARIAGSVMKFVTESSQRVVNNVQQGIDRMANLVGLRRNNTNSNSTAGQQKPKARMLSQQQDSFDQAKESLLERLQLVNKKLNDFEADWTEVMGRQQSPLIDRIPPRGVELWRDFWDTVRKQIKRINEEFAQLSRDVTRMVSGRNPAQGQAPNRPQQALASPESVENEVLPSQDASSFKDFYEKMTNTLQKEQQKLDQLVQSTPDGANYIDQASNLIDEHDDELTKQELRRNPALRQQIQQEISVFGSIFDIMRAFIQRLRESASGVVRDIISPGSSTSNNNDAVTPTSAVKPAIDQILGDTIDSQRNINSQAKPVLLPNSRPTVARP